MKRDTFYFQNKERLFDLLIHDLRSPLAIVSTSVHNLIHRAERYGPLTDKQIQVMERIGRNVQKSQVLLQEMVEVLRSEEGIFQREYFYLEPVLLEALMDALEITLPEIYDRLRQASHPREFQTLLESQGIFFQITGRFCRSFFCHDQRKIQQILRNLVSNALKYRRRRVGIQIEGETEVCIRVEDDGPGMSTEGQEKIFNRFVQLEPAPVSPLAGLGLGLAGVKILVEAMGGAITLTSQKGAGTVFMVAIPPLNRRKESAVVRESVLNEKTILAVDDEPDVLDILEEEINAECRGCRISRATTYDQAMEALARGPFDLVILDIMGVRGFDLLDEAKKRGLPVAMLTAHALSPETLKKSIEKGARAYLPKEKLGEVVPFLEDILQYEYDDGWNRLFGRLGDFFDRRFGPDWQQPDTKFWNSFSGQIGGRFDRVIIK